MDQDGIQRPTDSDVRTAPTHGDVETMSEKLAYRKFIKDSEFKKWRSIGAGKYREYWDLIRNDSTRRKSNDPISG